jgi:hypothetical protein
MQGSDFEQYFVTFPFLKKHFLGVFSIDTLPKSIKYRHFCICNTDKSTQVGQHWFCFLRNHNSEIECFDSLGINEEKKENLKKYCCFNRMKELIFNETAFQTQTSNTCGLFTIYFIFQRMHNLDLDFDEFLDDFFDTNESLNEIKVQEFCDSILENKI